MVNDCATCHNTTQPVGQGDYRRQIVSSGGVGGDFLKTSHHAYTGTGAESVTSPDCVVCHSNSKHRTLLDPQVRLFDSDTGSTITYNGTPASLETFCIACHDADGGPRFSDAKVPVNIETAWLASSHKASGLTCFGDGASTGCHANGHGSDKTALKAPFTGATPDQEAFCYVCHDADGPATSNIQIDFSGTLTLPGSSWNGAYLNTHHDVSTTDQTFSGAAIECKNCHDPHVATAAQPSLGNVDPDDGRVPAPDNTFTGSNFTTEFCMECHDNSYPAAVRPPTHVLTNLYTLWTDSQGGDQHGPSVASQSVSLRAGSGYARGDILNCDVCHDTGHGNSQNLFQLRTTIYSKNGLTPLASDAGGTTVYMTDVSAGNTNAITNGKNWCSTCHPQPMGGTKSKGCIDCHHHGDRF